MHESAARESSLNTQVMNMELELKRARDEVRRLKQEKDSYEQDYHDLTKTKDETHVELKDMRAQLRDFKYRETRMLSEYSELEEENIMLQKQISNLRTSQVNTGSILDQPDISYSSTNATRRREYSARLSKHFTVLGVWCQF